MSQRPENFKAADEAPETTLVTPRFDAEEARRAHPVVPLAEAPTRVRAPQRSWTPALLVVVLLVVAALGGAFVTKLMQGPRAERVQEAEQIREQTPATPVQTTEAPQPSTPTPASTEVTSREDKSAKPASRDTQTRRTQTVAPAPVAVERAREDAEDDEHEDRRGKGSRKRRGHDDDEVEKAMHETLKRAKKGKAPRLVDVLTSSP